MGRKRSYPTAFRQQMVDLVRSGRSANDLAKEFEPNCSNNQCLGCVKQTAMKAVEKMD